MGALPSAFGLPFCIIKRIENVLLSIEHTQAIPQKVVTFFENLKSWSHLALFVWDWIYRARRIASDFTRFYRIAKGVYLWN